MQYKELGRTGLNISRLGFGTMRLPVAGEQVDRDKAVPMLRRAVDMGVNYFDSAVFYHRGEAEVVLGEALRDCRERVYISTKNPVRPETNQASWRRTLEESLQRLGTDYVDLYCAVHGINRSTCEDKYIPAGGLGDAARQARDEGLIRHIGASFHDTAENLGFIIDSGEFEFIILQYNLLDRSNEEQIHRAREKGIGIIVMGPVGGGRLVQPSERLAGTLSGVSKTPDLALRFVLAHPGVTCALSGMGSEQMLEENAATASRPETLSADEYDRILHVSDELRRLADLYCTGCNYCMPCPAGVNIPANFSAMNLDRVYGLHQAAVTRYQSMFRPEKEIDARASACIRCGRCEELCPQKIEIMRQLEETVRTLET